MLSVTDEQTISLREAAHLIGTGRSGKPLHVSTVLRWILRGTRLPGGAGRVRLEAVRLGGQWRTTREALQRFAERLTPTAPDVPLPRTAQQRQRASERAARQLEALGM